MLEKSQKIVTVISARTAVTINLKAAETLNPSSVTRFFPNTVEEPNAKAARNANKAALFERLSSKIFFQKDSKAIIYPETIATRAQI
jgi:hypothetical protein